ncbi:MAG: hypothetical protein J7K49_00890 [Thaumarchaeota archaeon]|nr:hypothetical protein [Nitrososphaerota archaeon]
MALERSIDPGMAPATWQPETRRSPPRWGKVIKVDASFSPRLNEAEGEAGSMERFVDALLSPSLPEGC